VKRAEPKAALHALTPDLFRRERENDAALTPALSRRESESEEVRHDK
jgi:hypothetical protein